MKTSYKQNLKELLNKKLFDLINNCGVDNFQEIRIRIDKPPVLTCENKSHIVTTGYLCSCTDIKEIVMNACGNSFYSYEKTIKQGYIPLKSGGRIGIAGNFGSSDDYINSITSINIRMSNEIKHISDKIFQYVSNKPENILIAGPPGCGKTTLLRDTIRAYSQLGYRVSVADERGEISGAEQNSCFDLGANCDCIVGINKAEAINRLLRTMNPQIIAFDEIGSAAEAKAVYESLNSGTKILCTIHADNDTELRNRLSVFFKMQQPFDVFVCMNRKFEIEKII